MDAGQRAAASQIARVFRESVSAGLDSERRRQLTEAGNVRVDELELRRALLLADRAVRSWASTAMSHDGYRRRNAYERLAPLAPGTGRAVQTAASDEQKEGLDAQRELIAEMVWGIGERLVTIETELGLHTFAALGSALSHIAGESAEILLAAGRILGDPDWPLAAAGEVLTELALPKSHLPDDPFLPS